MLLCCATVIVQTSMRLLRTFETFTVAVLGSRVLRFKVVSSYISKLFFLMLSCFKPSFGRLCFIVSDATTFREQCRECHKAISHRIQGRESCKFFLDELRGPAYGCLCVLRSAFLVKRRNRTQYKNICKTTCSPGIS